MTGRAMCGNCGMCWSFQPICARRIPLCWLLCRPIWCVNRRKVKKKHLQNESEDLNGEKLSVHFSVTAIRWRERNRLRQRWGFPLPHYITSCSIRSSRRSGNSKKIETDSKILESVFLLKNKGKMRNSACNDSKMLELCGIQSEEGVQHGTGKMLEFSHSYAL